MSTEPEFYHMGMYAQNRDTDYGMMIIPGLAYADTIGSESRKIENCTSMTPQGAGSYEGVYICQCILQDEETQICDICS